MTDTSKEMKMIDVGLFSLGMCCQTRHQLKFQQPSLKDLGIEAESVPSGYFDWLICPPESAAKIISDGLPQFKPGDITEKAGEPYWTKYGFYFWHEFRQGEDVDIKLHFDRCRSKFDHLREQFQNLDQYRRLVFVLSNVQRNLTDVQEQTGTLNILFSDSKIKNLRESLENFLDRKFELLVATTAARFAGDVDRQGGYHLEFFNADKSEWKGDKSAWNKFLRGYLTRFPVQTQQKH